jgi:hypothetical protein
MSSIHSLSIVRGIPIVVIYLSAFDFSHRIGTKLSRREIDGMEEEKRL